MDPFFGPGREETLARLYASSPALPITLGDGMPSFVIECRSGTWLLAPLRLDPAAGALAAAEPVFETRSKAEFVRWLELWPWLGTGVPRAAPPTSATVTEVTVEFDHLALPHRTVFRWARPAEGLALERVAVEAEREIGSTTQTLEVPAHLWWEFLDVLRTVFPEEAEKTAADAPPPALPPRDPDATAEYFRLPPRLQAARHISDVPTVPEQVVDTNAFLRGHIRLGEQDRLCTTMLTGPQALELLTFMLEFAAEYGLSLPS